MGGMGMLIDTCVKVPVPNYSNFCYNFNNGKPTLFDEHKRLWVTTLDNIND